MAFTKAEYTEALMEELRSIAPPNGAIDTSDVDGIAYDRDGRRLLVAHKYCRTSYPDRSFTLYVDGCSFRIWALPDDRQLDVTLWKHSEHLTDAFVTQVAREAVGAFNAEDLGDWEVTVGGRTPPPRTVRPPEILILRLNKLVDDLKEGNADLPDFEDLLVHGIVTVTLLPEEFDLLLAYLAEKGADELQPRARELFEKANRKRSELKQGATS